VNKYQPIFVIAALFAVSTPGHARTRYVVSIDVPKAKPFVHTLRGRTIPDQLWNNPCAATMWGEARNQPDAGRRAVCHVLRNRVKAHRKAWGFTVRQAAFKRKQFSWLNKNDPGLDNFKAMLNKPKNHPDRILWEHLKDLSDDLGKDNTGGATSYVTNDCNAYWLYSKQVIGVMFDHTFFRDKTKAEWKAYYRDKAANAKLAKARKIAHKANRASKSKSVKPKFVIKHSVKITSHKR